MMDTERDTVIEVRAVGMLLPTGDPMMDVERAGGRDCDWCDSPAIFTMVTHIDGFRQTHLELGCSSHRYDM